MYNQQYLPEPGTYGQWGPPVQQQPDQSAQLIGMMLPLITTLPGLTDANARATAISTELQALAVPPQIGAQPTAADYNALRDFTVKVEEVVKRHVDASTVAYAALRKQLLIGLLVPLLSTGFGGGGGGNNSSIMIIVMLMLFASGGALF